VGHVIFGGPVFRFAYGSIFGRVQLLQEGVLSEVSLAQEIEKDGFKRLCGHGYFPHFFPVKAVSYRA
jgi:hypothetical protein